MSCRGFVWCILVAVCVSRLRASCALSVRHHTDLRICAKNLGSCTGEEKTQTVQSIQMLFALELFDNKQYSQSMKEFIKLNTDPADVIELFPDLDKPGCDDSKTLKGKDLENALDALIEYLVNTKDMIEKTNAGGSKQECSDQNDLTQQLEIVDTTLLKCYLQTSNTEGVSHILRGNNCSLEEAERTLLQHGKHCDLVKLYQNKGQHSKALQLLRDHAKVPNSSLKGYTRTKYYLQQLGAEHIHLIFKFSDWILKEHPEEGLKIFTDNKVKVKSLPRATVLDFLKREHDEIVIPYLEHVIHTWNDTNPQFYDALINMYREKITEKKTNSTEEELQRMKSKLLTFLKKSLHYNPEKVLQHFPYDTLFEERAIILGKLGRHEEALAIYVLILGNVEGAIEYCENIDKTSTDKYVDEYVILMRILIKPEQCTALTTPLSNVQRHPNSTVPDLESTLRILEKHAHKISPLKALAVLPDSVSLCKLKYFLESAMETRLTLKRRTQVRKSLLYVEHSKLQELKQYHVSKSVLVEDCNVCPVCKKHFGNQSAFMRFPNGDIVHYSCGLDK